MQDIQICLWHTFKGVPLWCDGDQTLLPQAMQTATHRRKREVHSFCEQFEWDDSLECFWLDVIGESFVHAEGAFANVLTVCITHNTIEQERLRTGRLGANP